MRCDVYSHGDVEQVLSRSGLGFRLSDNFYDRDLVCSARFGRLNFQVPCEESGQEYRLIQGSNGLGCCVYGFVDSGGSVSLSVWCRVDSDAFFFFSEFDSVIKKYFSLRGLFDDRGIPFSPDEAFEYLFRGPLCSSAG